MIGDYHFLPCTPAGIMELLKAYDIPVEGKRCVVIGRSNIVGKPMAMLLLHQNGTVTICHSRTKDLPEVTRQADILVSAVGKSRFVTADMVKPGAVVIDVGMNRDENGKLCGDVDFAAVEPVASCITPVPGGVGPYDHRHAAEKYGHSRQAPKRPALTRLELSLYGKLLEKIHSPEDIKGFDGEELDCPLRGDAPCHHRHGLRKRRAFGLQPGGGGADRGPGAGLFPAPGHHRLGCGPPKLPLQAVDRPVRQFSTIRTEGGLAGFPCREESPYDLFTCGHSSTSISSALGVSEANYLQGKDGYVVAVIGDGALTGGLAYEGLNNAGRLHRNLIVIFNDNTMSISKNVGSMARYLSYIRTKPGYIKTKNHLDELLAEAPRVGPSSPRCCAG